MIIWRGRGLFVAILAFGSLLLADWLSGKYFHDREYYADHGWVKLIAFLLAAGIVWVLVSRFEDDAYTDIQVTETSKPAYQPYDHLFFIRLKYWPLILCGLGVLFFFF